MGCIVRVTYFHPSLHKKACHSLKLQPLCSKIFPKPPKIYSSMPLLSLPNELLYEIAKYFLQKDLLSFLKTSRILSQLFLPLTLQGVIDEGKDGISAISWAALRGFAPLVTRLMDNGVDVNSVFDASEFIYEHPIPGLSFFVHGETALHLAVQWGHKEVIRVLLSKGANPEIQNWRFETALVRALKMGRQGEAVFKLLLEARAGINTQTLYGTSALHIAAARGHGPPVQSLLSSGAIIDIRDNTGATPLHLAVSRKQRTVIELLLKNGADVNARDRTGGTPLMRSAAIHPGGGQWNISKLLLENGATTNLANDAGLTALDMAKRPGRKPNRRGRKGETIKMKLLKEFEKKRLDTLRVSQRSIKQRGEK